VLIGSFELLRSIHHASVEYVPHIVEQSAESKIVVAGL
jgi:hypothetical protein